MGWELRKNSHYYYSKERINGKPISKYLGKGEFARLISQLEGGRRLERHINKAKEEENRAEMSKIDKEFSDLSSQISKLVDSFLVDRGFYKTKSREWRYRKNGS